jgi:hypothetical protein
MMDEEPPLAVMGVRSVIRIAQGRIRTLAGTFALPGRALQTAVTPT